MNEIKAPRAAIRQCGNDELAAILEIINDGAMAYRGAIPPDCWHEPYMSRSEMDLELSAGVSFHGYGSAGELLGVMAIQRVRDVDLIRHAYVRTASQGMGIGSRLLGELVDTAARPVLVGTWAAATWAIGFYQQHGFRMVEGAARALLLESYWSVSPRQREVSVVLSGPEMKAM